MGTDAGRQWSPGLVCLTRTGELQVRLLGSESLGSSPDFSLSICMTSLSLVFLISKMGIMMIPISWNCCESYLRNFMEHTQSKDAEKTQPKFSSYK